MQRARPYLKVVAVLSSVCLVGAFVAYRAGAFDSPPPPAPPLSPETQPATTPAPASPANPDSLIFMAGSKSAFVYDESTMKALEPFLGQPAPATGTQSTPANPVFMGGSKYLAPLFGPSTGPGSAEKSSPPALPAPVPPKKDQ
jgi:hypothetical protein